MRRCTDADYDLSTGDVDVAREHVLGAILGLRVLVEYDNRGSLEGGVEHDAIILPRYIHYVILLCCWANY